MLTKMSSPVIGEFFIETDVTVRHDLWPVYYPYEMDTLDRIGPELSALVASAKRVFKNSFIANSDGRVPIPNQRRAKPVLRSYASTLKSIQEMVAKDNGNNPV